MVAGDVLVSPVLKCATRHRKQKPQRQTKKGGFHDASSTALPPSQDRWHRFTTVRGYWDAKPHLAQAVNGRTTSGG